MADGHDDGEAALAARFARLPFLLDACPALIRRGRFLTVAILVGIGAVPFHVDIDAGRIAGLQRGPLLMRSWRFAVRATAPGWSAFWQPMPAPGANDLLALAKRGEAWLEGDLQPLLANLQYVKDLLALPRHDGHGRDAH